MKEERRLRVDNQPYGAAFTDGIVMAFDSATCFAYAHPTIGSMDDLNAAKLEDVQAFFETYYAPNNATLVVVGDFRPAELRRLVNDYFAEVPRHATPPRVSCDWKVGPGERRRDVEDAHANLPAVVRYYRVPADDDPDTPALDLLTTILGEGESSRLNVGVVRHDQAALQAATFIVNERRGPGVLIAYGVANQQVDVRRLDSLLVRQLDSVRAGGVTAEELARAKATFRATFIHHDESTFGKAEALNHYDLLHGALSAVNTDLDRYLAVTADDIRRVAGRYLVAANAAVLLVRPKAGPESSGGAQ